MNNSHHQPSLYPELDNLPPVFVRSKAALAALLGVHEETVSKMLREPENPGVDSANKYNVAAWKAFFEERKKTRANDLGEGEPSLSDQTKSADLRYRTFRAKKAEREMEILEGKYKSVEEVAETWNAAAQKIFSFMVDLFSEKLIEKGENPIDANEHAEELANAVFSKFNETEKKDE